MNHVHRITVLHNGILKSPALNEAKIFPRKDLASFKAGDS